MMICCSRNIY